jgi:NAD(P)-dependent dehydrogenase (short-subunit alcohol dehydrogenase family)
VVVNDLGVGVDGSASDERPADEVVSKIASDGGEALANYDDVSTWDGAERLVQSAIDRWGRLDIVVNNAGILRDRIIWNMTEADFDDVVRVHLKSTFCTTRHAAAHWRALHKAGEPVYGRVINTASAAMLGNTGQANYSAAKGAIASMTLTVALETQSMGVTCNAVRPSAATRMTQMVGVEQATGNGFNRMDPVHVGEFVSYLASPAAGWISGQLFAVYGDRIIQTKGWHNAESIAKKEAGWTAEELVIAMPKMAGMAPVPMIEQLGFG